ncbi:cryptochrome/photolyase family protein [Inhella gelatinilytica]|uniref:Deoxyribodipyrimidine photo-lyase n=1 Tax=Inhella gelatinilytica TaxID=2795030 RepID=A0A931NF61_9BURK|nr:deoxyribodipyrimidine photo-lyase [Inhella gelatinilytica]MBH9553191.1 deoxyribodipyrimidine photo-lyase [Inhella gelatinilytica]
MSTHPTLVWLRRDLRLHDHAALELACRDGAPVLLAFVFDPALLAPLPRQDRRVDFILEALQDLERQLRLRHPDLGLIVRHAPPREAIPALVREAGATRLVYAHDDDPYALARDLAVQAELPRDIRVESVQDVTVFERRGLLTGQGKPYTVFTPYKNAWLRAVTAAHLAPRAPRLEHLAASPLATGLPSLADLGFEPTDLHARFRGGATQAQAQWDEFRRERLAGYADQRDFPARKGPSYLSPALRFGLLSIRELAREAWARREAPGAAVWLSELIWRDFYHQVLHHHPGVVEGPLKPEYAAIHWEEGAEADAHFAAWCAGQTGYPLVDAAMRQLNQTGYMHNRLRMVTASFLCKSLGLNWQRGEAYFAEKLLDFELASNSGGWQWAASCGCDAQPWFRIFNPVTQSEKFDPDGAFIRRYVPELASLPSPALHAPWSARPVELGGLVLGRDYPRPVVDHAEARARTLARYGVVKRVAP